MLKKYLLEYTIEAPMLRSFTGYIHDLLNDLGYTVKDLKHLGHGEHGDVLLSVKKGEKNRVLKVERITNLDTYKDKVEKVIMFNPKYLVHLKGLSCKQYENHYFCALAMENLERVPNIIRTDTELQESAEYLFEVDSHAEIDSLFEKITENLQLQVGSLQYNFLNSMRNASKELLDLGLNFTDFHENNVMYDPKKKIFKVIDFL
jgi:hypothetical protein